MYFESLTAPSIPCRLSEISQSSQSQRRTNSQLKAEDIITKSESTLRELGEVMSERWEDVEVEINRHHFYVCWPSPRRREYSSLIRGPQDKVFTLKSRKFEWAFNVASVFRRKVTHQ